MKIIQIELPNELTDELVYQLFEEVSKNVKQFIPEVYRNSRKVSVRVGTLYTSL